MPFTVTLNWPFARFAPDEVSIGHVSGLTTTEKLRVALKGGFPLSATVIEMALVEFAWVTKGRQLKLALVLLT